MTRGWYPGFPAPWPEAQEKAARPARSCRLSPESARARYRQAIRFSRQRPVFSESGPGPRSADNPPPSVCTLCKKPWARRPRPNSTEHLFGNRYLSFLRQKAHLLRERNQRLQYFRTIIFRRIDQSGYLHRGQPIIRARLQHPLNIGLLVDFRTQPSIPLFFIQNHRHSVMDLRHEFICGRCEDRERALFLRRPGTPSGPYTCHGHDGTIFQEYLERPFVFSIALPFKKSADWNNTASLCDSLFIEPAFENRFTLGIDRGKFCGEFRRPFRNETPFHDVDIARPVHRPDYRSVLRG